MASQKELLSVAGKQEPMVPSKAEVQDMGGPTLDWTTAQYANFKFDAATGVSPDQTILPHAGVAAEPVHKMSEEDEDPSDDEAMKVETADADVDDTVENLPEEEDDAEKADKPGDEEALAEGEDEEGLDIDLADLADDDTDMVELGSDDVEEVSGDDEDEDAVELDFSAEEMDADMADEDEKKKQPFAEGWKKMKEEDEPAEPSEDDLMSETDDKDEDDEPQMMSEEEMTSDEDEKKLGEEEDELKKAEDEMMQEGRIKVSFKFDEANSLFENNQTLTEEEKQQSRRLFEAAVRSVAQEIGKSVHAAYSTRYAELKSLQERKFSHAQKAFETKATKQIDQYLSYVVEQWTKENKVALRSQLHAKLTENFMQGLKSLFTKHYIEVPESRVNVVEALAQNVKALKKQVQVSEANAVKTHAELKAAVARERQALVREHKARLIAEAASVLPAAERGKFIKRAEVLSFTNSKTYKKDLVALREQHFGANPSDERPMNVPDAAPLFESKQPEKSSPVSAYTKVLDKFSR